MQIKIHLNEGGPPNPNSGSKNPGEGSHGHKRLGWQTNSPTGRQNELDKYLLDFPKSHLDNIKGVKYDPNMIGWGHNTAYGSGVINIGNTDSPKRTLAHEIGHHVQANMASEYRTRFEDLWANTHPEDRGSREGFANMYADYHTGGEDAFMNYPNSERFHLNQLFSNIWKNPGYSKL